MKTNDRAEHRYAAVSPEKAHGATYTPTLLADFVAKQLAAAVHAQRDAVLRILDPAVGDAVLLASLVRALRARGLSRICVHGFDTNPVALAEAATRFAREFPDLTPTLEQRDFLDDQPDAQRFDAVIANPPYVRTQVLGAPRAQQLARRYGLTGRVDLYYAFLLAISRVLAPDGTLGIIVSNRFMTTRSGHSVRKALHELYDLLHVWDLGDTRLFDAAVLPAVLLARTANARDPSTRFTSIYETKKTPAENARTAIEALDRHGVVATDDGRRFDVVQGSLDPSGVWRMATVEKDEWLSLVRSRTFARFGDLGKIRVGVKTTADSIFIRDDWHTLADTLRPEVLRPLATHHLARRYRALDPVAAKHILYTHESRDGRRAAIDLTRYPRTGAYLQTHRERLERRRYVIDAGRQWYEIWVPQDPAAWSRPKLVFPDISAEPVFWIDDTGSIVNGDCYWLALDPGQNEDLLWLALAVGNSQFALEFYDHRFNNRLYASRRRFITQYVSEFPLPDPALPLSKEIVALAKQIYRATPSADADRLARTVDSRVHEAFGLSVTPGTRASRDSPRARADT
ncbi:MAG TPA: N-6 DNA methylase [Steroidobacteraceae bacterium]|nr:N-6 DNA methylase [Steroidobacteraceae bacterium]